MDDASVGRGEAACAHCGLPVPTGLGLEASEDGAQFCCTGCEAAYAAIHGAGLGAFYAMREVSGGLGSPASQGQGDDGALLDSDHFMEAHTEALPGGLRRAEVVLEGVHCAGCVWLVERMPVTVEGVYEARLDLTRGRLALVWDPAELMLSEVAAWLGRFGYAMRGLKAEAGRGRSKAEHALLVKVGVAWALAGNVMLLAAALYSGLDPSEAPTMAAGATWLSLVLSGVSVVYGGQVFVRRAWASVRASLLQRRPSLRGLSMDVPIALGIVVGWVYSAAVTWQGQVDVWFDSISVLIAALLTARWLHVRGHRMARDAADRLLELLPTVAWVIGDDGEVRSTPADGLVRGDRVRVRGGEVFPADGRVLEGQTQVDRALLTGESRPEALGEGERVHAGATNVGSPVVVEVEAAGDASRVGRLMQWLSERSERRAPVVQLADRIGGAFVLAVVVAAGLVALGWALTSGAEVGLRHAVALLVVACPCALSMATPLTLTVAVGRAARRGVFVKHDDVLESLTRVDTALLDKTGTLTTGRMKVTEVVGDAEAAVWAASLEASSRHPIAEALVEWGARERGAGFARGVRLEEVEERPGEGMRGRVNGVWVGVGKPDALCANIALDSGDAHDLREAAARIASQGCTPVAVTVNDVPAAMLALADAIRPEAPAMLAAMRARGIRPMLVSGDHPAAVGWAAAQLGIDPQDARGGVTPEGKRALVESIKADRPDAVVLMVGDGVNDAAALQAADVGVAVQGGAQVSVVAADVFMTQAGLEPIGSLLDGADRVQARIKACLVGSLVYNLLGVGLAAAGVVTPLLAAVLMPISSLAVVAGALLVRPFNTTPSTTMGQPPRRTPAPMKEAEPGSISPQQVSPVGGAALAELRGAL